MNRRITILAFLVLTASLFSTSSCTKKQQPDTLAGKLRGQWKKIRYATDDNRNGLIDQNEINNQRPDMLDELIFDSDTSGYQKTIINNNQSSENLYTFRWYTYGDSLYLNYQSHFSVTYYIESINSANLVLYSNTAQGLVAYYYGK